MILPRLGPRLRCLLGMVPAGGGVADIGAGHGALAAHLAARGCHVIAVESARGAYAELRANLRRWEAGERVDARLGEGFAPLRRGEVDGAVAAGLGGHTLVHLAEQAPATGLSWLALQCVQRPAVVDAWLASRRWPVRACTRAQERGHSYPTWVVEVPSTP